MNYKNNLGKKETSMCVGCEAQVFGLSTSQI